MEIGNYAGVKIIVTSEQYDKCKKKIDSNKDKVINDLLKRISNLEFDVAEKQRIIIELEKWLKEQKDINDRTNSIIFNARGFEDRVILNKLNELKGSDNSADIRQEEIL